LRDQADNRNIDAGLGQLIAQGLFQQVSNFALAGCAADVERLAVHDIGGAFGAQQLRSHLRPVAVGDHQAIAETNEPDHRPRGAAGVRQLLDDCPFLTGSDERVASNRD
jgi:hypothetical protein